MLEQLKRTVFEANFALVKHGLVLFTWGNVSAIDRARGLVAIKPSGVACDEMRDKDMIVVDLDGKTVEGALRPSSDAPTHIELYKAFPDIGGVVHTHSTFATAWAQAGRSLPCYGTTHADYFFGKVPCTRDLVAEETATQYEKHTGLVIAESFKGLDASATPAILVKNHGPFCWGKDAAEAVYHAVVLEEVAKMAFLNENLGGKAHAPQHVQDKHYARKHGINAYYGQEKSKK